MTVSAVGALVGFNALGTSPAGGASVARARFSVSLAGTVTTEWNVTRTAPSGDCTRTVSGGGVRGFTFSTRNPSLVSVVRRSGGSSRYARPRVRFEARVSRTGSATERMRCPGEADKATHFDCVLSVARFGAQVAFSRPGRNRIVLGSLSFTGTEPPDLGGDCPPQPHSVPFQVGLPPTPGRIDENGLFNPRVRRIVVRITYRKTTRLRGSETGRIVERGRWALTFKRL